MLRQWAGQRGASKELEKCDSGLTYEGSIGKELEDEEGEGCRVQREGRKMCDGDRRDGDGRTQEKAMRGRAERGRTRWEDSKRRSNGGPSYDGKKGWAAWEPRTRDDALTEKGRRHLLVRDGAEKTVGWEERLRRQ